MATAYVKQRAGRQVLLEEVASVRREGEGLVLKPLFGEQKRVRATIREIDFLTATILLEEPE